MIKIIAVGDIMPGGVLNKTSCNYFSQEIKEILSEGDVRIGTLETAIGNEPTFYDEKMKRKADVIYARDEDMVRLKELDINIVSLANNHFTDLGPFGAKHTIEILDKMGILHCGAGSNLDEASRPAVIEKDGKTYAFIGFCDWRKETVGWCPLAKMNDFGVNPMTDENVERQIKIAKTKYDSVIVIPHWGVEYQVAPTQHVYKMAKLMLKSGADLILGGHTHCIQPIFQIGGKSVVFSMGNFLFPDRLLCYPRSTYYSTTPIDVNKLPFTDGYPRYVDTVTYKIWKPMARYGLIVKAEVENEQSKAEGIISHLSSDNYLEIVKGSIFYSNKINQVESALNSGVYLELYFIYRLLNSFKNRLIHILNIIK